MKELDELPHYLHPNKAPLLGGVASYQLPGIHLLRITSSALTTIITNPTYSRELPTPMHRYRLTGYDRISAALTHEAGSTSRPDIRAVIYDSLW
jgi:hypothetical protein